MWTVKLSSIGFEDLLTILYEFFKFVQLKETLCNLAFSSTSILTSVIRCSYHRNFSIFDAVSGVNKLTRYFAMLFHNVFC